MIGKSFRISKNKSTGLTSFETATWELNNPASGRRLVLVGMMHLGEEEYFEETSKQLETFSAKGYALHYERLKEASEKDVAGLSPKLKVNFERLRSQAKNASHSKAASVLKLAYQKESLSYPANAENVDITDLDLFLSMGHERASKIFEAMNVAQMEVQEARKMLILAFRMHGIQTLLAKITPQGRAMHQVVLRDRNAHAVQAAKTTLETSNLVLVWGADHLPGLIKTFQAAGFKIEHSYWRKVCEI